MTWQWLHAQRLLVERGKTDVIGALLRLVADRNVDENGLNAGAVHALWTTDGVDKGPFGPILGFRGTDVMKGAVSHPSPAVRRTMCLLGHLGQVIEDSDVQVRLAGLLSLGDDELPFSQPGSFKMMVEMIKDKVFLDDSSLCDALTFVLAAHPESVYGILVSNDTLPPTALRMIEISVANAARKRWLEFIFDSNADFFTHWVKANPATASAVIGGLASGWPSDRAPQLSATQEKAITDVLPKLRAESRGPMLKLLSNWKIKGVTQQIAVIIRENLTAVGDEKAADEQRISAVRQIIDFGGDSDETVSKILETLSSRSSPLLLGGIFDALGNTQSKGVGAAVTAKLPSLSPAGRAAALRLLLEPGSCLDNRPSRRLREGTTCHR